MMRAVATLPWLLVCLASPVTHTWQSLARQGCQSADGGLVKISYDSSECIMYCRMLLPNRADL